MWVYVISVVMLALAIFIYWRFSRRQISEDQKGIALDNEGCYMINKNNITKCSRIKNTRKFSKTFKCDLIGGKFLNGDLVVHTRNELIWLDRTTLQGLDYMKLPFIKGYIAWIDYNNNQWWVCDVHKGQPKKTKLFVFSDNWELLGLWRFPIEDEIKGGCFGDNNELYLTTDKDLYIVRLPESELFAEIVNVTPKPIKGDNFCLEKVDDTMFVWGLKGEKITRVKI